VTTLKLIQLTGRDVPFLEGLQAAGNAEVREDAATLIAAITKYGTLEIWLA
jgi:hypothetical protein